MADKKIGDKLPRWAKIGETEASQDVLGGLIKDNLAYDAAMQEKLGKTSNSKLGDIINDALVYGGAMQELSDNRPSEYPAIKEDAMTNEVIKKLNSLLPYVDEKKWGEMIKPTKGAIDPDDHNFPSYDLPITHNLGNRFYKNAEEGKYGRVAGDIALMPIVEMVDAAGHMTIPPVINGYKRLYNYIANLINDKKLDDANELLDAIQEMRLAERDLSDKQNKNGKQVQKAKQ